MTKFIAVVCNNEAEWQHFYKNMEWNLSKQNLPYRWLGDMFEDLSSGIKFIHFPNNMYKLSEKLYILPELEYTIDRVVWMCSYDKEIDEFLSNWRGDE